MMKTKPNEPRRALRLTTLLALAFFGLSAVVLLVNGGFALYANNNTYEQGLSAQQQLIAKDAGKSVSTFVQDKFNSLETAVALEAPINAITETQQTMLGSLLGHDQAFRQLALLDSQGRQLAQVSRSSQALSSQFISQLKDAAAAQTTKGGRYVSPVYINDVTSEPLISISIPIKNVFGDFQGTLVAEVNLKFMWDLVDQLNVGQTGYAYVVDDKGNLIAFQDTSRVLRGENVKQIGEVGEFVQNPSAGADLTPGVSTYNGLVGTSVVGTYVPLGTPPWAVVIELPWTEAYQPIVATTSVLLVSILILVLLSGGLGIFVARRLGRSIVHLTETASRIAGGELQLQAEVNGPQEVEALASAFNTMTVQLSESIEALDQRVAERTKALATSADVSRRISTILDLRQLVVEVVEQVRAAFGYYHVQIYFVDPETGDLVMAGGTGEAGQAMLAKGHRVQKGKGLVGRAAETDAPVLVSDVSLDPSWLPNPLLPDTRSELAVPMTFGDQVIGVFDVQSDIIGRFTEADSSVQTALASQIATAVQNARQYEESKRSAENLTEALGIAKLAYWEFDVEKDLFTFNDQFYAVFHTTVEREGGYLLPSAQYIERFVHPDDAVGAGRDIARGLSSKERYFSDRLEHRVAFSDGGIGYFSVYVHIERDSDGKILRVYGANQDITERKQLEELNRHRAEHQEMLNSITQKIQGTTTLASALQITARELGQALGMKPTLISLDPTALSGDGKEKKENAQ